MKRYYPSKYDFPLDATPFHRITLYAVVGILSTTAATLVVDASGYTPYLERKVVESIGEYVIRR